MLETEISFVELKIQHLKFKIILIFQSSTSSLSPFRDELWQVAILHCLVLPLHKLQNQVLLSNQFPLLKDFLFDPKIQRYQYITIDLMKSLES